MATNLSFNIYNIIIISGVIQGIIFSTVLLFQKKYKSEPYRYLALLVLTISLSNLYYWFRDTGLSAQWTYYRLFYIPFNLLLLPFYYFFVCTYLDLKKKFFGLLIAPFIIRLIFQAGQSIYRVFLKEDYDFPETLGNILGATDTIGSILFMLFTTFLIVKTIFQYEKSKHTSLRKTTKWLKQILYFGFGIFIVSILIMVFKEYIRETIKFREEYYVVWIGLSVLIYWLGYLGVFHLGIFNQRLELRTEADQEKKPTVVKKPALNTNRFAEIDLKIQEDKMYLDSSISLQSIALLFNLSEGHLSQMVNAHTGTNFSSYINNLRIIEAKKLLTQDNYKNYTIIAIGLESGFNSKSAFYSAFKKSTGLSPSQYRKAENIS